ncbi:hypothetical protein BJX96DRAFT_178190 [Aspergillus floccosus]
MGSVIAILNAMLNRQTTSHALLLFSDTKKAWEFSEFLESLAPSIRLVRRPLIEDSELSPELIQPHLYHLLVATPRALLPRIESQEVELGWFHYILIDGPYEMLQADSSRREWMRLCAELMQQNGIRVVTSPGDISKHVLDMVLREDLPDFEKISPEVPEERLARFELNPGEGRREAIVRFIKHHLIRRKQLLILTDSFRISNGLRVLVKKQLGRRYAIGATTIKLEEARQAVASFTAGDTKVLIHHGGPLDSLNDHKVSFVLFFTVPVALRPIIMAMNYIGQRGGYIFFLVDPESESDRNLSRQWTEWQQTAPARASDRLRVIGLPTKWPNERVLKAMAKYEPKTIERRETGRRLWEDYGYITFPSIDHATRCLEQQDRVLGLNVIELQYAYTAEESTAGQ